MNTAREALLALLQDATLRIRKNFGMYGQIRMQIRDVTPERLTVAISTRPSSRGRPERTMARRNRCSIVQAVS